MTTILARFNGRTLAVPTVDTCLPCLHGLNQFNADRCNVTEFKGGEFETFRSRLNQFNADRCNVAACADRCADKPCYTLKLCRNKTCRAGIGEWCREMVQAEVRERLESESVAEVTA